MKYRELNTLFENPYSPDHLHIVACPQQDKRYRHCGYYVIHYLDHFFQERKLSVSKKTLAFSTIFNINIQCSIP